MSYIRIQIGYEWAKLNMKKYLMKYQLSFVLVAFKRVYA